ncbi:hypothetical protein NMY22_g5530 [Coprinellus aureogranulatus]|nr:hypothetical protein NMY22_g5530 [Coprinellus aureogranulatus]
MFSLLEFTVSSWDVYGIAVPSIHVPADSRSCAHRRPEDLQSILMFAFDSRLEVRIKTTVCSDNLWQGLAFFLPVKCAVAPLVGPDFASRLISALAHQTPHKAFWPAGFWVAFKYILSWGAIGYNSRARQHKYLTPASYHDLRPTVARVAGNMRVSPVISAGSRLYVQTPVPLRAKSCISSRLGRV